MSISRTQRGDLRDKVAVHDPATVPENGDSEAAGLTMRGAARGADNSQAQRAQRAVPQVDASRAVSTAEFPERRRFGALGWIASAGVVIVLGVGAALYLTLPG